MNQTKTTPGKLPPTLPVITDAERAILDTFTKAKWAGHQAEAYLPQVKEIIGRIGRYQAEDGELRPADSVKYVVPSVAQWEERIAVMKQEVEDGYEQALKLEAGPREQAMDHLAKAIDNINAAETYTPRLAEYHENQEWMKDMETWFRAIGLTTKQETPTVKFYVVKAAPAKKPAPKSKPPVDATLN